MTAPRGLRDNWITTAFPPDAPLIRACRIRESWARAVDQVGAMLSGVLATICDRRMV